MKAQEIKLLRVQQIRVLQLWLGPLALSLNFHHLLFLTGQLNFIIRIRSLNFCNNYLPSALVILSIFDHLYAKCCKNFKRLPERQHSFCLSWHCNLSATSRRLAIDQMLEIKDQGP